jgi:pimeloyl-ACP methyl ester carboxylesterase
VPPIGDFIEVDGARLHYLDRGEGSPIVMIHGLGGNLYHYTGTIFDDIASTSRAIAIDRPGCGYSERPGEYDFSTQAQANIIQRALDKLGVKDPLIVGHSLGGGVALAHAVLHPGKARGYVLIAPAASKPRSIPPMFKGLHVSAPLRRVVAWTIGVPMSIKAGPKLTAEIFAPQPVPSDFATESGGLLALRPKSLITNMNDFAASGPSFDKSRERYSEIKAPVLCLYGLGDRVLDAEFQLDALKPIPALEVQRLDAAGHMLMHVEPKTVIAAIRKLDAQTAATASGAGAMS